jgi:hypothetical protein
MNMTAKTVTFAKKAYSLDLIPAASGVQAIPLSGLNGGQLLELYNLVSANLGRGRVKRFADTKSAIRRTWAILEEYDAQGPAGAETPAAAPKKGTSKPKGEAVQLSDTDKAQIKQEAADRKASTSTTTVERWRTPKRREPSKRCYMPRPGSKQDVAYKLLTQEGGIRVEDLCTEMSKLDKAGKNSTEWKEPGTIWGSLNYLFVTQKGYGLDFDGERIRLLVGKDEVPFSTTKKA